MNIYSSMDAVIALYIYIWLVIESCSGDITTVNLRENRDNGENFCEITAVITGMGTALTGIPR